MTQQPPEQLFAGKFRLVKLLGRGAMGEVWLANEVGPRGFSRQVAVKRLLATEGISDYARESFLAEAQVIARLDHPNIVHLIELGESDDRGLYLVLDYIDGSALDRVIRKGGPLSPAAVALIGREVAKALDAVHSMVDQHGNNLHVVHRDVSPANILIGRDGRIRLSDFGVARIHGLGGEKTETGVFKGKLPYMPPEQALGEPFDGRADIFSLGITLYEGLLGGRLRKAETQGQLIAMIATEGVPQVRESIPDAMPELASAIDLATEFKAHRRTPNAGQLAGQMHNVLYRLGPTAEEQAIYELCERVALASGATGQQPRQPWSMALTGENSAYGSGPRSFQQPVTSSGTGPQSGTGPHSWANPATGPTSTRAPTSVPPEAVGQASVTKIASISDASRPSSGASAKTWMLALGAAVVVGAGGGAAWFLISPPPTKNASAATTTADATDSRPSASGVLPGESSAIVASPLATPTADASGGLAAPSGSTAAAPSGSSPPATRPTPPTARTTQPAPSANAPDETGTGSLVVTVNPWGNVTIDGRPYGSTPLAAISLPAGNHTVSVNNPELGASRSATVKVSPGKTARVGFDLKKAGK
ncbi:MAG: protein kinase [Polyangiaceae bacterium]|jgi:serine/threonine protein kinase|nr:protein kinase [Polyangiaceae bacterium]MBK8943068.1 protein kinase [Polyangiaceae bacterium]